MDVEDPDPDPEIDGLSTAVSWHKEKMAQGKSYNLLRPAAVAVLEHWTSNPEIEGMNPGAAWHKHINFFVFLGQW